MELKPGDRVHVKGDWNWPKDCTGVITDPPEFAQQLAAGHEPWQGHFRSVQGREGPILLVWVNFDEPQKDGDGDGPYSGGEVEAILCTRV